ncbi:MULTISPECIES: STAS domain-containing protein [unclassified Streptomyces]|uniref:STAS domain-containing protein n=1 Tax=unclassified Streptomyces TaxID=2593676 RepID=UPI001EE79120|nr:MULTISPECIES: STAS domain-containing protein [unclassified Streptomyces]
MSWHEAVTGRTDEADAGLPRTLDQVVMDQYAWHGAWVVAARGSYDMSSIGPLADVLGVAAREHPKVVLEASGITFADSSLLNLLILTRRAVDLRVAAPPQQLRRLLEITGVDAIIEVRATVDEAAAC